MHLQIIRKGTVGQLFLTLRQNWTLAVFNAHEIVNIEMYSMPEQNKRVEECSVEGLGTM